jgi:hypothetical protein
MLNQLLIYFLIFTMFTPIPIHSNNQVTTEQIRSALPKGATIKFIVINQDYILVGGELNVVKEEPPPPLQSVGYFAKLDPMGDLLWLKKYWGDEHNSINAFIENEDGYLLGGSAYSRYGSTFMIIKTDINGDAQWVKYSGDCQQTDVKSISTIGNGLYLINGSIITWDSVTTPYNIIIDKNGNVETPIN